MFFQNKIKYLLPLLIMVFLVSSGFNSLYSQAPTPTPTPTPVPSAGLPKIKIYEALGYQGIESSNSEDFFVLIRYELLIGDTPDSEWCKAEYLLNNTGCDGQPPNPTHPFSLKDGRISIIYYDSSDVIHAVQAKIPRIGKGLAGIYADSPASDTYGFNVSKLPGKVCLVFNSDYFVPYANSLYYNCVRVINESGGRQALANQISGGSGIVYRLETDLGLPMNTLVSSKGRVTPSGQLYLEEALQGIVTVAQNSEGESVFQLGASRPNQDFTPIGSTVPLQEIIDATATASDITSNMEIVSGQYLGFDSGSWFGLTIFLFLGLLIGALVMTSTKSSIMAILSTILTMLPAVWIGSISIAFLFSFLSLFILFGSWYWIRKEPG